MLVASSGSLNASSQNMGVLHGAQSDILFACEVFVANAVNLRDYQDYKIASSHDFVREGNAPSREDNKSWLIFTRTILRRALLQYFK